MRIKDKMDITPWTSGQPITEMTDMLNANATNDVDIFFHATEQLEALKVQPFDEERWNKLLVGRSFHMTGPTQLC